LLDRLEIREELGDVVRDAERRGLGGRVDRIDFAGGEHVREALARTYRGDLDRRREIELELLDSLLVRGFDVAGEVFDRIDGDAIVLGHDASLLDLRISWRISGTQPGAPIRAPSSLQSYETGNMQLRALPGTRTELGTADALALEISGGADVGLLGDIDRLMTEKARWEDGEADERRIVAVEGERVGGERHFGNIKFAMAGIALAGA
jgi:hypothetical protein